MSVRTLALFLTVLAFATMTITCGLLLVNGCPDVLAVCSSILGLLPLTMLVGLLGFFPVLVLHVLGSRSEPSTLEEEFALFLDQTPGFSPPLFLVNEVYRL